MAYRLTVLYDILADNDTNSTEKRVPKTNEVGYSCIATVTNYICQRGEVLTALFAGVNLHHDPERAQGSMLLIAPRPIQC